MHRPHGRVWVQGMRQNDPAHGDSLDSCLMGKTGEIGGDLEFCKILQRGCHLHLLPFLNDRRGQGSVWVAEGEKRAKIAALDDTLQGSPFQFFNDTVLLFFLDEGREGAAQEERNLL